MRTFRKRKSQACIDAFFFATILTVENQAIKNNQMKSKITVASTKQATSKAVLSNFITFTKASLQWAWVLCPRSCGELSVIGEQSYKLLAMEPHPAPFLD
jgi:hypothetical protein